jgi:ATP-dependent DNA ligase
VEHGALGRMGTAKTRLVVEVRYDQVTGDRFRHGTKLVCFRPDKAPKQCTFEQFEPAMLPENFKRLLTS